MVSGDNRHHGGGELNAHRALWQDARYKEGFEMALKLAIGNKNYSSWSMRPWLALRANDIPFEEIFIPLYTGDADKQRILNFTHSGKVPALIDGDITVGLLPSSNTSPNGFRKADCGPRTVRAGRMRARFRRRCIPGSWHCATNAG
jgi:hypothetical protein